MNQTYQPSGRVSILFLPVYISALLLMAAGAAVCMVGMHTSPSFLTDLAFYCILTGILLKIIPGWSIRTGKVRNPMAAKISGAFLVIWYWYLMALLYAAEPGKLVSAENFTFSVNQEFWSRLFSAFLQPLQILNTFSCILEEGFAITGRSGTVFFVIRGWMAGGLLLLVFLVSAGVFASAFYKKSLIPFSEAAKSWSQEIVLPFRMPEDLDGFLARLLMGDTKVLTQLEPLSEVNVSYLEIVLYVTAGQEKFYVNVIKKINSGETEKRSGRMVFEEEETVRFLTIDRSTGFVLLTREQQETQDTAVRVVTAELERKSTIQAVLMGILGAALIIFTAVAILKMDDVKEFLSDGALFYLAAAFFTGAVNFIRSFQKEKVIVSTEDRYEYDALKKYMAQEKATPVGYRLFYLFLMLSAVFLFLLCLWRIR